MNKRRAVGIMALVMIGLVGFAGSLWASTTGVNWYATDGDVNLISVSNTYDIYIESAYNGQIMMIYDVSNPYPGLTINVEKQSSGEYIAFYDSNDNDSYDSSEPHINLGTTGYFDFYIADDSTYTIAYSKIVDQKIYQLTSPAGQVSFSVDAAPVPIPGSALLLGSGLLGLVGIGLRRQRS